MDSNKSPGPNGLKLASYKKFKNFCGLDIFAATTSWLENGFFPPQINQTTIVPIPKIPNPTNIKDFRPISLCNVLYKIISKTLANRLHPSLNKCILFEQSAFMEGHSILDNAFIASETIPRMKCKSRGKVGEVALKIDISKAF